MKSKGFRGVLAAAGAVFIIIQFFPYLAGNHGSESSVDFPSGGSSRTGRGLASDGAPAPRPSEAAAPVRQAVSIFTFRTAAGVMTEFTLVLDGSGITLDGAKLAPAEVERHADALSRALAIEGEDDDIDCAAGGYVHHVKENGRTRTERGCAEDPRFGPLKEAFTALATCRQP